jgi:hypothetical protein
MSHVNIPRTRNGGKQTFGADTAYKQHAEDEEARTARIHHGVRRSVSVTMSDITCGSVRQMRGCGLRILIYELTCLGEVVHQ